MPTPPAIHCVQFDIAWENKPANFARVRELLSPAQPEPGALVVLPEMFATGFSMNVPKVAETPGGDTEAFLAELAREHGVYVVGGVAITQKSGIARNEAVVFTPAGALAVRYAKMQPFSLAAETSHYVAGDTVQTFQWHGWRVAPFICYDLRFPELFRAAVRGGAELFVVIANWPEKRQHHWRTLLQARAIENQACIAAVNRCGSDPVVTYAGGSLVANMHGELLAEAGPGEQVLTAFPDLQEVRAWRAEFPALRDMREL